MAACGARLVGVSSSTKRGGGELEPPFSKARLHRRPPAVRRRGPFFAIRPGRVHLPCLEPSRGRCPRRLHVARPQLHRLTAGRGGFCLRPSFRRYRRGRRGRRRLGVRCPRPDLAWRRNRPRGRQGRLRDVVPEELLQLGHRDRLRGLRLKRRVQRAQMSLHLGEAERDDADPHLDGPSSLPGRCPVPREEPPHGEARCRRACDHQGNDQSAQLHLTSIGVPPNQIPNFQPRNHRRRTMASRRRIAAWYRSRTVFSWTPISPAIVSNVLPSSKWCTTTV